MQAHNWLSAFAKPTPYASTWLGIEIPIISTAISFIAIIIFVYSFYQLVKTWVDTQHQLTSAKRFLEDLNAQIQEQVLTDEQYEAIGEFLLSKPSLKYSWSEMQETIIKLKRKNAYFFHNTLQAEAFFTPETIYHSIPGWLSSIPAILTGLGLLGTFCALLLGLAHLNVMTGGKVEGIDILINSLSGKFSSSIVGLLGALLFTGAETVCLNGLNRHLYTVQHTLNQIFPRITSEKLLSESLTQLERQTEPLEEFGLTVAEKLTESVTQNITPEIGKMIRAIEDLNKTTEALRQQKSDTLAESFGATMKEVMDEFRQSMTGAANSEIQGLAESLSKASTFLAGLDAKNQLLDDYMGNLFKQLEDTLNQQRQQSSTHANELQDAMGHIMDRLAGSSSDSMDAFQQNIQNVLLQTSQWSAQMEERMQEMTGAFSDSNNHQKEQLLSQTQALSDTVAQLVQKIEGSANTQQEGLSSSIEILLQQIQTTTESQTNHLSAHHQALNSQNEEWLAKSRNSLEEILNKQISLADSLSIAGQKLEASTGSFDQALAGNSNLFRQLQGSISQLETSTNNLSAVSKEADNGRQHLKDNMDRVVSITSQFSTLLQDLENLQVNQRRVYETLDSSLGNVLSQIQKALQDYSNTTHAGIQTYTTDLDAHLKGSLNMLGGTVETLDDQLSSLTDMLEKKLVTHAK